MIDAKTMNHLIKTGVAIVIKESQRASSYGIRSKTVDLNSLQLKSCNCCGDYLELDKFQKGLSICDTCRAKQHKKAYKKDLNRKTYHIWHSMKKRTKGKEVCSLEEFREFYSNAKDEFTGRTLEEDFLFPHHNKGLRLEIDHILPIASGGKTVIDNLQVLPSFLNQAKKDLTLEEWKEIEKRFIKVRQ